MLATLACLVPLVALALEVPPTPQTPVVDHTNTLTSEQINSLVSKIEQEKQATGNQIAVLMISSLEDEALEDYSIEVARKWGIGEKDKNNGILLLIAKDDRKLRIEVGYGLEGALPDIRANQIIKQRITPAFRDGDYFAGIDSGLTGIITAIHNESDPALSEEGSGSEDFNFFELTWMALIVIPWITSILARSKSWWAGGVVGGIVAVVVGFIFSMVAGLAIAGLLIPLGLFFDWAISKNYQSNRQLGRKPSWWAGGSTFGGGGSSGGSSFGGGSFGGGGSSGSW